MAAAGEAGTSRAEVEAWVREELGLEPDASVQISEKPGTDPRCSETVTEVAVASPGQQPYAFHIEAPLGQLTRMDLLAALAFGGSH